MRNRRGIPSRREFLQAGAVAMTGAEFGFGRAAASGMFQSSGRSSSPVASVKALVFDTFGTVVDWRTSVTQEVEATGEEEGTDRRRGEVRRRLARWVRPEYEPRQNG